MNRWVLGGLCVSVGMLIGGLLSNRGGYYRGAEEMRVKTSFDIIESHRQHDQMCRDYLLPSKKNDPNLVPDCVPEVRELLDDQVMWDSQIAAKDEVSDANQQ